MASRPLLFRRLLLPLRASAILLAVSIHLNAQDSASVPVLARGNIQAQAFGGFSLGQSFNRISTTEFRAGLTPVNLTTPSSNGSIGGGLEAQVADHFAVGGELSYIGGSNIIFNQDYVPNQTPVQTVRASITAHSRAVLGLAGAKYLFPVARRSHAVPFVAAGGGVVRVTDFLSQAVIGASPGQTFSGSSSANHGVGYVGVGSYYFFGERVGIFVEGRGIRGPGLATFGRLAIGVFFEVR